MLAIMTDLWIPDVHRQGEGVLQHALGFVGVKGVDVNCLPGDWHWAGQQKLTIEELVELAGDWKTVVVFMCCSSPPDAKAYIVVNGCTLGM